MAALGHRTILIMYVIEKSKELGTMVVNFIRVRETSHNVYAVRMSDSNAAFKQLMTACEIINA